MYILILLLRNDYYAGQEFGVVVDWVDGHLRFGRVKKKINDKKIGAWTGASIAHFGKE